MKYQKGNQSGGVYSRRYSGILPVSVFRHGRGINLGISDRLNQKESATNKKIYIIGMGDKTLGQDGYVRQAMVYLDYEGRGMD